MVAVSVVVEGVHGTIPEPATASQPVHLLDPPPPEPSDAVIATAPHSGPVSDADRIVEQYRKVGEAQKHEYGVRGNGAPNYNAGIDVKK